MLEANPKIPLQVLEFTVQPWHEDFLGGPPLMGPPLGPGLFLRFSVSFLFLDIQLELILSLFPLDGFE